MRIQKNTFIIITVFILLLNGICYGATQETVQETETNNANNGQVFREGYYIVGEDIEPGTYNIHAINGFGTVRTYTSNEDRVNDGYYIDDISLCGEKEIKDIYENESAAIEEGASTTAYNIILANDECVEIGTLSVEFIETDENRPLYPEGFALETGYHIVGKDVTAGTYTFKAEGGFGTVRLYPSNEDRFCGEYYDDEFSLIGEKFMEEMGDDGYHPIEVKHIILKDGMCISIGTLRVSLQKENP